jgi:DNA-binding response OmpR family regulator
MKVLIVEDDPEARKILSLILKLDGFNVITASDGRQAVEVLKGAVPELVLLDVMMPEMDGYEVCQWARANSTTAAMPIVLLSGKADPESVAHGLEVGADEYLAKPILPSNLTRKVHEILGRTAPRVGAHLAA